jgi:ABC-type multidrug transport system fused ATPase/permease subunit
MLYRWFSGRAAVAFRRTRETVATMIVNIVETFNGIRAVQAFRREKRNDGIFAGLNNSYKSANRDTFKLHAVFIPGTTLIGNVATVTVLLVGGYRVAHGGLDLGVLTAFLLYVRQFYDPMEDVAIFYNSLQSATAALEKIAAVLAERPGVPEPATPVALPSPVRGSVELREVHFAYRDDQIVLPSIDLEIPAGQTVALVGATGAGKTTIAKLISRFYDPTGGTVALDGVDLRDVSDGELRRAVVMITQDGFLFSGSVADNIGFGRLGATQDEIEAAARAVGAHAFIEALPDGYDTDVRKRGGRLSAGQRQLVAFARAFLADPAVLILDEATSSLDVPTERAVQRALRTVLADRTALIIAHRLSTVEIADRVLVLADGRVIEDGRPEDLVAAGDGHFASLHQSWRDSLV